jgi:putative transposase
VFIAEGKGQISPWSLLKKQIFLGDENFVEEMEATIDKDKDRDLSEVPSSQRRAKARALTEYETMYEGRNKSILVTYKSGGYTMDAIADHFNLHCSSVSKNINFLILSF